MGKALAKAGWVEDVAVTGRCWPVLIHQLLALALAADGVTIEAAWQHLSRVPDFRGICREEYDRLLSWMLQEQSLLLAGGQLILGPEAERRFGRRNFMELYAVFSSPQSYTVRTQGGDSLGSLNQTFVDQLADGVSCFLLGGRPWLVVQIEHDSRCVVVEPAPRGRRPTWGGYLPQFLGRDLCQEILGVVTSGTGYPYLGPEAASVLAEYQSAMGGILQPGSGGVEITDEGIHWWTFAGGRINSTLRHALLSICADWTVVPDNFGIRIRGAGVSRTVFDNAGARLRRPDIWEDQALWDEIAQSLPAYRLSKFQPLMPPWVEREVIARYLLDVAGACEWLCGAENRPEAAHGVGD